MIKFTKIAEMICAVYAHDVQHALDCMKYGEHAEEALKFNSTPRRWEQYQAGEITREQAVKYAASRVERMRAKQMEKNLKRLETAENAPEIAEIEIHVEWVKSRAWGLNPHATVYATDRDGHTHTTTGAASGCGYDKQSAAVADALNQLPGLLVQLYRAKDIAINADDIPACAWNDSNTQYLGYGAGYGPLPYFERGVGFDCIDKILRHIGFTAEIYRPCGRSETYLYKMGSAK